MKRYLVISPTYDVVIPILDDGSGPTEPVADVVEVEAGNKRDALLFGVRLMRKQQDSYINQDPDNCPFTRLQVEPVCDDELCELEDAHWHGRL